MRNVIRIISVAVLAFAALLVGAGAASAHVTVHSTDAKAGGYAELTFRVPTERDDASTVKLQVNFPTRTPLASVSVKPHAGWTFSVNKKTLAKPVTTDDGKVTTAVDAITWTAARGGGIAPGEFDEFDVSVGPLPASGTLTFPAIQTYSNGSVVRWIEVAAAGAPEPAHPAPSLQITPASAPSTATETMAGMHDPAPAKPASQTASLAVGVTALVLALVAVGLGVLRLRRPRQQP